MVHPKDIIYRERNKLLEKSKKDVLLYKYLPDRARSMALYQEFKDSHLEKDNYKDDSPSKNTQWIRPRVKDREEQSKMRYSTKTENERVNEIIKNSSLVTYEPLNTEILTNTPYREVNKSKWVASKPFIPYKGHKERQWSETKILSESPEPYTESAKEIKRNRKISRELSKSTFWVSFPKDTWDSRISRTKSIRSYMGIIGALKSVSPSSSIDYSNIRSMKLSHDFTKGSLLDSSNALKDEEPAKGKDVRNAAQCLMLIHSHKSIPKQDENLKFSHNKHTDLVKVELDELHWYEKINKIKTYYKSAQGVIANQLSRKAHRSRAELEDWAKLSKVLSNKFDKNELESSFSSNIEDKIYSSNNYSTVNYNKKNEKNMGLTFI